MKERLVQLLDMEQLSPSKFADIIGVQRSSVSHVVSGRNKPSFDFLQKTLKAFPGLNAEWLILGVGTMYEQMGREVAGTLFDSPVKPAEPLADESIHAERTDEDQIPESGYVKTEPDPSVNLDESVASSGDKSEIDALETANIPDSERTVVQVMVFYNDDTFRSYRPSD